MYRNWVHKARIGTTMFLALVMMSGCGAIELTWSEEVRLPTGSLILVERTASGEARGEIGTPTSWKPLEMTLYIPPDTPQGTKGPPLWRSEFIPILLDYEKTTETWSVVATFAYCDTWDSMGRPDSPYIEFQSRAGGSWKKVALEERHIEQPTNLLVGVLMTVRDAGKPALVRENVKEWRRVQSGDYFKKITVNWTNNCS